MLKRGEYRHKIRVMVSERAKRRVIEGTELVAYMSDGTRLTILRFREELPTELDGFEFSHEDVVALIISAAG